MKTHPGATHVVGAIGPIGPSLRRSIVETFAEHAEHDLGPQALLLSRGHTYAWRSGESRGVLWSPQAEPRHVRSGDDATHLAVAPSLSLDPDVITLHSASWGLQPVYVAEHDSTLLFATTSSALLQLLTGPLDPDWDAWAAILSLGYPIDGRTPFRQIRRLRESERRVLNRASGGLTQYRGVPRAIGGGPVPSHGDVVDALRGAITTHPALAGRSVDGSGYLASLPLSGGWDSRLLGVITVDAHGPTAIRSVTTATHRMGTDPDVTFGTLVGDEFGVTQHLLMPDGREYPGYATRAFALAEHETAEHVWYEPVASVLKSWKAPVIDGFGGDVTMKNVYVRESLLRPQTPEFIRDELWRAMSRQPAADLPGAGAPMLKELTERTRAGIESCRAGYDGLPDENRLVLMSTRSMRGVSVLAYKMTAEACEQVTPFMHPDVTSAILSIPWKEKSSSDLARALIDTARPGLSRIRSTNDRLPDTLSGRRRANTPESQAWSARQLDALSEHTQLHFTPEDVQSLHAVRAERWRLRLILMSDWLQTYHARLTSTTPPWWA